MGNKSLVMVFGYLAVASIFVAIAIFLFKSAEPSGFEDSQTSVNSGLSYENSADKGSPSTTAGNIIGQTSTSVIKTNSTESSNNKVTQTTNVTASKIETTAPNSNNNQVTPSENPSVTQVTSSRPIQSVESTELRVNINTASKAELCKLKGIGDVKANAIIAYREANSGFKNIDEIKNVSGIGDATFANISAFIYVENPQPSVQTTSTSSSQQNTPLQNKININSASSTELQKINGVGPAIAQRIIDYREENGYFKNVEDIINVKGIGDKIFEKMKDQITV